MVFNQKLIFANGMFCTARKYRLKTMFFGIFAHFSAENGGFFQGFEVIPYTGLISKPFL